MKSTLRFWIIGIVSSIVFFFVFGIPTNVIPNPLFTRMVSRTVLDYVFLVSSSVLLGAYLGVHLYKKNQSKKCTTATYSGAIGSILAFGCPVCNKLLVLLFGATALLTYFEPYRHMLGFASIAMLGGALYWKTKS